MKRFSIQKMELFASILKDSGSGQQDFSKMTTDGE